MFKILVAGMSSGMIQMFCHLVNDMWGVIEELFFSPYIYFVVPFGTYLSYDEDILEFCFMLILIGIDWVFFIYY